MTLRSRLRLACATLACAFAGHALAQSQTWAWAPGSAKDHRAEKLRAAKGHVPSTKVRLPRPEAAVLARVKAANAGPAPKRVQIGVGRPLGDPAQSLAADWRPIGPGWVAQWEVASTDAAAVRVALAATRLPPDAEVRFTDAGSANEVYGPYTAAELQSQERYWSPVIAGDSVLVEIFLPGTAAPEDAEVSLVEVAHLFASPRGGKLGSVFDNSGECEQDVICRVQSDPLLGHAARAVAAMVFTEGAASYVCTGTLLNASDGSLAPYFYTANHCIGTATTAATLTTHWFFERNSCDMGGTSASYRQVAGGAVLL